MSYTPINWQTGDTITAAKLNRCDNGWGYESTQLFSETVTTSQMPFGSNASGLLEYSGTEYPSALRITFGGTEYDCPLNGAVYEPIGGSNAFRLQAIDGIWRLYTPTAGTYSISAVGDLLQVSDNFSAAVHKGVGNSVAPMLCVNGVTTYDEMVAAQGAGQMMYFVDDLYYFITGVGSDGTSSWATFIPDNQYISATFDENDIFILEYS